MSASAINSNLPAVVQISDYMGPYTEFGTGFLIAPNLVLSATHIVSETGIGVASNINVAASVTGPTGAVTTETSAGQIAGYNQIDDANDIEKIQDLPLDFALIYLTNPINNAETFTLNSGYDGGPINVTGYPGTFDRSQFTASEQVTQDPDYSILIGNSPLGNGSSGGPLYYTTSSGALEAVGVVAGVVGDTSYAVQLTSADLAEIERWESMIPLFNLIDTSMDDSKSVITKDSYNGPLSFLAHEDAFSYVGADNVQISSVTATNPLIATGSGEDILTGSATGSSILDGGTNANIENDGGNGDTIFVQNGYLGATTWDFLQNFHGKDEDIIFGYIPGLSHLILQQTGGLASDHGATIVEYPGNGSVEEITFSGVALSSLQGCAATINGGSEFRSLAEMKSQPLHVEFTIYK